MAIETVGIVGAGTMGGGIAINLAQHGFRVLLHDARPAAAAAPLPPFMPVQSRRGGWPRPTRMRRSVGSPLQHPWPIWPAPICWSRRYSRNCGIPFILPAAD